MRDQTKRSLNLADEQFKRKLGVKRGTYELMLKELRKREASKKKSGRPAKLSLEDQLILSLSFWREYRTHFHLAEDWDVNESTVRRTIERVEDCLLKSGNFSLPGRKVIREANHFAVVVIDASESPVEKPKKSKNVSTQARKSVIRKNISY